MRCANATSQERGAALVIAICSVMLLTALASALILITVTETGLSANYRDAVRTLYAADAAVARAAMDLAATEDWTSVLSGAVRSTFADGAPGGVRQLAGTRVDLDALTNRLRCGSRAGCDPALATAERPWGANNPMWQLYAWGPIARLHWSAGDGDVYVAVWVGDDHDETDGNPLVDESEPGRPGHGVIRLVGQAFGPQNSRRMVMVSVARRVPGTPEAGVLGGSPPTTGEGPYVELVSWREVR